MGALPCFSRLNFVFGVAATAASISSISCLLQRWFKGKRLKLERKLVDKDGGNHRMVRTTKA